MVGEPPEWVAKMRKIGENMMFGGRISPKLEVADPPNFCRGLTPMGTMGCKETRAVGSGTVVGEPPEGVAKMRKIGENMMFGGPFLPNRKTQTPQISVEG